MNRRRFLRAAVGRERRPLELSCERLYMKYLDSQVRGTTPRFLEALRVELDSTSELRLRDAFWLTRDELRQDLEPLFQDFRARGGRIQYA